MKQHHQKRQGEEWNDKRDHIEHNGGKRNPKFQHVNRLA